MKNEVSLNTNIQIACLPSAQSSSYPAVNQPAWTVGWGTTINGGGLDNLSNVLKNVKITVYQSSFCGNVLPFLTKSWNSQICSGELAGGKDSCQGDSGGALYVKDSLNGKEKFIVSGIVSYGVIFRIIISILLEHIYIKCI